jgi:hypothetical protein
VETLDLRKVLTKKGKFIIIISQSEKLCIHSQSPVTIYVLKSTKYVGSEGSILQNFAALKCK